MKLWFKQLFCSHIWKTTNTEFLRSSRLAAASSLSPYEEFYDHYAIKRLCVKCGKTHITEQAELRIE